MLSVHLHGYTQVLTRVSNKLVQQMKNALLSSNSFGKSVYTNSICLKGF